jgi:hypothetical protein
VNSVDGPVPPRRLAVLRTILSTFSLSWSHRGDVARTVAIPLLLVVGCTFAWDLAALNASQWGRWVFWVFYLFANSWLAIVTHRMVLMDKPGPPVRFDRAAGKRLALFAAMLFLLWALYTALKLGIVMVAMYLLAGAPVPVAGQPGVTAQSLPVSSEVLDGIASWLPFLLVGRFCLLLPSVATDQGGNAAKAWRDSTGNSWRLAIIVGVLPWLLNEAVDLLYRDGATSFEFGLLVVLSALCTVLEVVALSLSYRALTSPAEAPAPPPTDPPA